MPPQDKIKASLIENLLWLYPQGPPADERQIQQWRTEIVENDAFKNLSSSDIDHAIEKAIEEWKLQVTGRNNRKVTDSPLSKKSNRFQTTKQQTSFSLLAQLDSTMFAPRITLEQLQAATTSAERLSLFQKVANVDDMLYDWHDILPLVQDGMENPITRMEYAKLHRQWFGQGRASIEHWPIRCDLCRTILSTIFYITIHARNVASTATNQGFSATHEQLYALWILWCDMWMDLLQRPLDHDENAEGSATMIMGQQVLLMLSARENTKSFVNLLALVDPFASWFHAWTRRLVPLDLACVVMSTKILPILWHQCTTDDENLLAILTDKRKTQSQVLETVWRQHSVSILRSTLVITRIRWFPWASICNSSSILEQHQSISLDDLKEKFENVASEAYDGAKTEIHSSGDMELAKDQLLKLFEIFFRIGIASNAKPGTIQESTQAQICGEALEAILCGAKILESSQDIFAEMLKQCEERTSLSNKGCFDSFLSSIVKRIE